MGWLAYNWKRYTGALLTFGVLFGGLVFVWLRVDRSSLDIELLLFITTTLLIIDIARLVFGVLTIKGARIVEENVTYSGALSSHELFGEVYKHSPVPYVLVDVEGVILSTNTSALRLFGIEEGVYNGKNVFELLEGKNPQSVSLIASKLKSGVFVNDEEVQVRRTGGDMHWALLSLFSFTEESGNRRGLLTLIDITKQKEVDRAKTEFVSLASHQLRSPISAMKWNLELLGGAGSGALSLEQRDHLEKVHHNLMRMDTLVGDFLNVSKLELGTLTPTLANVEIEKLFEEVLADHARNIETKHIVVQKSFDTSLPTMVSDSHLLHMILNNLISNAIKYTKEGGMVTISYVKEGDALAIRVSDTGIGIPADDQDKIFTKIFRATNARTEVSDGTGLGLYIAREAARVLGGTITFESKEHVGTTFMVRLPL